MASTAGDMSHVCRCCLQKEIDSLSIFQEIAVGDPLSFAALVENCVGIEIIAGDGLPKHICTKCSNEALNYFNFKKMCLQSEKILRPSAVVELEPLKNVACQTDEYQIEPKIPASHEQLDKGDKQTLTNRNLHIQKATIEIQEQLNINEIHTEENNQSFNETDNSTSVNVNPEVDNILSETHKQGSNMGIVINNPVLPLSGESIFTVLDIEKEKDKDVIEAVKELGDAVEKLSSCNSRLSGDLEDWLEGNEVKEREVICSDASNQLSNVVIGETVGNYIDSSSSNIVIEDKLAEKDEKTENLMKERDGDDAVVLEDLKQKLTERLKTVEAKEDEYDITSNEKNSCDEWKPVDCVEGKLTIKSIEALTDQSSKESLNKETGAKEDLSLGSLLKTSEMNQTDVIDKDTTLNSQTTQMNDKTLGEIISSSLDRPNIKINMLNEDDLGISSESKSNQDAENFEGDRGKKRTRDDDEEEEGSAVHSVGESVLEGPITKKICLSKEDGEKTGEVTENINDDSSLHHPESTENTKKDSNQNAMSQIESAEEKGNVETALNEEEPLKDFSDDGLFEEDESEPESSGSEYIPADSPARSDDSLTVKESTHEMNTRVKCQISKLREQGYNLKECRVVLSDIAHPNSNALSTTSSISSRISSSSRMNDLKEADETLSTSSCTAWIKVEPELAMEGLEEEEEAEENAEEEAEGNGEEEGEGNTAEVNETAKLEEKQETAGNEESVIPNTAEPQGISAETQRPLAKFVSGRKRFLCPFCAKAFRTKSQMMLHRSLHTGDLPYPCEVCGKRFPLRCRLLRHMSVHDASITCEFCGMDFKTHILLGRHIKARHTIPSYSYPQVTLHAQPVANKSGQRFPCRICPKVFSTVNGLKAHKRVHVNTTVKISTFTEERVQAEEKPAVSLENTCKICGMTFPNALYLKSHMVCHNIIRPNSGKPISIESPKPLENLEDNQRVSGNPENKNLGKIRDESVNVMEPTVLIHESTSSFGEPSYQMNQNQQYNRMNRFVCSVCSQIFQSRSQLLRHQTLIHRSLKCEICACMFSSAEEVQNHKLAEHPSYNAEMLARKRHKCNVCGKGFPKHSRLVQHMAVHSVVPRQSSCDVCGKYFASPELLEMHKKTHETNEAASSSNVLTCGMCHRVFTKRSRLKRHMLLHESQSFPCSKCPKTFISRELLAEHQSSHSAEEEQGVSCTACGRMFTNRGRLKQHVAVHTKSGFVSCDNCFKVFANKQVLEMHVQTCTNPDESSNSSQPATSSKSALTPPPSGFASCTSCSKAFPTKNLLTEHEKTCVGLTVVKKLDGTWKVLDNEDRTRGVSRSDQSNKSDSSEELKVFACKMCNKRFNNYHGLNSHMRFHQESVGIYKCELCHKKFQSRNKLSQHMSSHSAVYRCGICSQAFGMVDELKKHVSQCMAAQSGVAPNYFFCNGCSEVFHLLEELAQHVKCHAEEFPHVCTECYKVFAHPLQLTRHISTHLKDDKNQIHICPTCQKVFSNSSALEKHQVVHTGEKRFQCCYCFQRFSQKSSLNRHQLTQHETKS